MREVENGNINVSIFWLNISSGMFGIIIGLVLLYGAFFETLDVTPGMYGASPRDVPILCSLVALLSGTILLIDAWKSKSTYMNKYVPVATKGQPVRLLKSVMVFALVPVLLELLGFYTTILSTQVLQKLLAGVRNLRVILVSVLFIAAIIYFLLQLLCRCDLPKGFLI